MRTTGNVLLLLTLAATAFAANPFAGTWKFNAANSMSTGTGAPPKEEMLVIEEKGDQLKVALTGTAANGSPIANKFTVAATGGVASIQESPFNGISAKFVAPNIAEVSYMIGGKEVSMQHALVSGDGKTLWLITRGANSKGVAVESVSAFDNH